MSETAAKLFEQIRELPEEDGQFIADELDAEADGYDPMTDPEWRAELDRRIEAVGNGTMEFVSMEEAVSQLEQAAAIRREKRA